MSKKQKTKKEVESTPQIVKQPKVEIPVMEKPKPKKVEVKITNPEDNWEIKNRTYFLTKNLSPITKILRSQNIYWFDEVKGYERELKLTENQKTCFVDEMVGEQRLEHIIFRDGVLNVEKSKVIMQKMLSLYHPHKDILYKEHNPIKIAVDEVGEIEKEIEALNAAKNLDIDMAEAVMRVEIGSEVSKMSSKELKRDLLLYAKRNPNLFLELVNDDNVILRNFGIKATEMGVLKLSSDQRNFLWGTNDRKLMTVPFDEHPYSALAQWFKTDEGMEVYSNIEKRLN